MSKYHEINGRLFEISRSKGTKQDVIDSHTYDYLGRRSLFDFYQQPSTAKEAIWAGWKNWAEHTDCVEDMRVKSANTFMFSIGAYYVNPDTGEIVGYFYITPAHNRLYLLD